MALFTRLFQYKARADRAPLEDFLTEILADLLTRMPPADAAGLFNHAFDQMLHPDFTKALSRDDAEWRTQVSVPGGIADLILFVAKKPVLIIENKTWSGFQDHSTDQQEANQLTTYCRWLAQTASNKDDCAMLLVTGTTASPAGYREPDGAYDVRCRAQFTWAALRRWLKRRLASTQDQTGQTWYDLARELVDFIEEQKLSSEIFSMSDVSAAHLFIPSMDRWRSTFDTIWSGAQEQWAGYLSPRVSDLTINTDAGMIWQWRYAQEQAAPLRAYVALGLRFPDQSDWFNGIGMPDSPHLLMLIATDRGRLKLANGLPSGWIFEDEDAQFLASMPLAELKVAADEKIELLQAWGRSRLAEAGMILRSCSAE